MSGPRGATLLLVAGLALAGCTGGVPVSEAHVSDSVLLAAGTGFHEVDLLLEPGARITWSWHTGGGEPLYFDLHRHRGEGGQQVESLSVHWGPAHEGGFTADEAAEVSWMWRNQGNAEATLHYGVQGASVVASDIPQRS